MSLLDSYFPKTAKYKNKKEVPKANGKGTTTVYEYSDRQVSRRNNQKADRIKKLESSISDLRSKVKKDLKSSDEKTALVALAVGLIDHIYERVGNDESSKNGHFGVTGFKPSHVTFQGSTATIKYTGKSGVDHVKKVTDKALVAALKKVTSGDKDCLFDCPDGNVRAPQVNEYLAPFKITAKDIRGFHANREMRDHLKRIRSENGALPENLKEKKAQLKKEFNQALEQTAKAVGHEASTLKSQYLVPGLEDEFLIHGTTKKTASLEEMYFESTPYKQEPRIAALYFATKSRIQKEDEQVEKLVKPLPKKKPPRKDLRNEKVEEEDSDLKPQGADHDKDLSLNYKRVAADERSVVQFVKERGDEIVTNPDTGNDVKLKSLKGAEGRAGDLFNKEYEKWKKDSNKEDDPEEDEPKEEDDPKGKGDSEEEPPSLEDLSDEQMVEVISKMSPQDARSESYSFFRSADSDRLESRAKFVREALERVEEEQKGLDKSSPEYKELQEKKDSLSEAQFGSFLAIASRVDNPHRKNKDVDGDGDTDPLDQIKNLLNDEDEQNLMKTLGYDPSPKMRSLIKFLGKAGKIDSLKEEGYEAWSGSEGRSRIKKIYARLSNDDLIELLKENSRMIINVGSEDASEKANTQKKIEDIRENLSELREKLKSLDKDSDEYKKLQKEKEDLQEEKERLEQYLKGEEDSVHLADFLKEGFCPPDPLNKAYFEKNPDGKDCPIKIPEESRRLIKDLLIDGELDGMIVYNAATPGSRSDLKRMTSSFVGEGKGYSNILESLTSSGSISDDLVTETRQQMLQDMLSGISLNEGTPEAILLNEISSGNAPVSALSEGTDPPLNIMGKTASVNSLYPFHIGEVLCSKTTPHEIRNILMKKMSRQDTKLFTSNLDKIASLIQERGHLLGIPEKVAMDFAYRCDLISDAAERHVGLRMAGVENEIGETEHEHGFTQKFDEVEEAAEGSMGKKSYLSMREEDVDDIWEDY